jgi:hypothetical protein
MKRRRTFLMLLGSVAAVTLPILLWPREPEPEYNGVPLSTWLDRGGRAYNADFAKAIKRIGTNGIPILIRSLDYHIPRWQFWLRCRIAPKLPKAIVSKPPVQWLLEDKALRRANAAVVAFEILGPDALPALDDLRRIAGSSDPSSFAGHVILNLTLSKPVDFDPF